MNKKMMRKKENEREFAINQENEGKKETKKVKERDEERKGKGRKSGLSTAELKMTKTAKIQK